MRIENVTAALASNAVRRPDHPAIIAKGVALTHGALELLVQQVAGALRAEGLRQGDMIGLSMLDTAEHIVVMFAMMRLGVVMVPMDVRWTPIEKRKAMEAFGATRLVTDIEEDIPKIAAIVIDAQWFARASTAVAVTTWQTKEESPLLLSLSSGTTGLPKGPLIDHGLFMRRMFYESVTAGTNQADRNMLATPIYFGGGRNITLQNILLGATIVLFPPPYDIEELVTEINRHEITTVFLVPTQLRRLLQLPEKPGLLFPTLRMLMCSGATLHPEEIAAVRRRITPNILNTYATTDGGVAATLLPTDIERKPAAVGRPAYLVTIEIVDGEHRPLPSKEIGRIRYRSLAFAGGYFRNTEESAAAFHDGWFYPGDLGYFDEEGFLFVVGRAKDMIIRGGINIYPAEIESVLTSHPMVADAAVVGWPAGDMGEEVAAFVLAEDSITEADLIDYVRAHLARYKVPRRIFPLSQMPRNEAGKVNKMMLANMLPSSIGGDLRRA